MKRLLGILSILLLALLCRSALSHGASDDGAVVKAGGDRQPACGGALLATENPDDSVPELRLEEHFGSGVLAPSGKSRTLNCGSRRVNSSFRNILFKGGDTIGLSCPELQYLHSAAAAPPGSYRHPIPVILQNLRI